MAGLQDHHIGNRDSQCTRAEIHEHRPALAKQAGAGKALHVHPLAFQFIPHRPGRQSGQAANCALRSETPAVPVQPQQDQNAIASGNPAGLCKFWLTALPYDVVQHHHFEHPVLEWQLGGIAADPATGNGGVVLAQAEGNAEGFRRSVQENRVEFRCGCVMNLEQMTAHTHTPRTAQQSLGQVFECLLPIGSMVWIPRHQSTFPVRFAKIAAWNQALYGKTDEMSEIRVTAIPAFSDNYIWLISSGGTAVAVVDPGDAEPVLRQLRRSGLDLKAIFLTHHHADHTGGVGRLVAETGAVVYGPRDPRIADIDHPLDQGSTVSLREPRLQFEVIEVPGHTSSHIAFHGHGCLFCGDTLFSAGCGRLFEGTPQQMQTSLDKLSTLPPETRVFCAHEYTLSNCDFARAVEPDNTDLARRASEVEAARAVGRSTIPSTLGAELTFNPFLRTRETAVIEAARQHDPDADPGASTLAAIRAWKDSF